MKRRRGFRLLILIYVALDLSLAEMPGAFVFDPAKSVESIDAARGRLTAKLVLLPTPARETFNSPQPPMRSDFEHRLPHGSEVAPPGRCVVNCLPRATTGASPRPSEDPH